MNQNAHKPDFTSSYCLANEILVRSNVITKFPYSPKELVKEQAHIPCRSFTTARKHGVNISAFGSESAILIEFRRRHIIFYDETKPITHNRFSILHELGHLMNLHDLSITPANSSLYRQYEIEANFFAAQLLMPEQLLRELQHRGVRITRQYLQDHFYVSGEAANKRLDTLAKTNFDWRSRLEKEYDDIILQKFTDVLNKKCPIKNQFFFEDELTRQQERDSWF